MGRYRQERVIIKVFPEITLVFYDRQTILAFPKDEKYSYAFHKWYAPLGTYNKNWLPFKKALIRRVNLTKSECWNLAFIYDVQYKMIHGRINLSNRPIEVRYHSWSVKGIVG